MHYEIKPNVPGQWYVHVKDNHTEPPVALFYDLVAAKAFVAAHNAGARALDPRDVLADTGHPEADRLIGRLTSADPDFDDCTDAAVLIRHLVAEHRGPDGFATWKDAAVAERQKRVEMERNAGAQEPVAWMHLKAETFVIGGNDKRPFAKGFVPLYAQPQPMPDAARVALFEDDDERQEFANACDDFAACNETSVDYNLLMKWANSGLLECSHFEVTTAGNAEIERIEREGEA